MTKFLGFCLIGVAAYFVLTSFGELDFQSRSPNYLLKSKIEEDIEESLEKAGIPKSNGIHHVQIKYRSKIAHDFLKSAQPSFTTAADGKIWIEIEMLDLPDDKSPALITQTSVFDLKSNNKISEFGQTYYFKDFDKEKIKTIK
jgi:hypothetical protein